jgi:DNA-binding response OmpR family regulator
MPPDASTYRRILIAERDRNVRELQSYALQAAGFVVAFAEDGEAALAAVASEPTALVVTEILIPKLDGLTLCRSLRANDATSDVPVLVFSILSAAARAEEAGASAFLRKPFVESTFIATVSLLTAPQDPTTMEKR